LANAKLGELHRVLDDVVAYYNEVPPHGCARRRTPSASYYARAKEKLHTLNHQPHWRIRTDKIDQRGRASLQCLGKLRHFNLGWK